MPHDEATLIQLARDLSGGDDAIVDRLRGFLKEPPTTREEIGFYGVESAPPEARVFWGLVTALSSAGHLYAIEDKYSPELIDRWLTDGVFDLEALPADARRLVETIRDSDMFELEDDEEQLERVYETLFEVYGAGTRELESHLAAQGKALLSVDATDGDTLFFALVPAAVADRWRGEIFAETDGGHRPGIKRPQWDRFWHNLTYAYHFDDADNFRDELPPNTRQ